MYDAIVIGSGIGGLTAAGLLAGVDGRKVLVLEKHTEPGGLTHAFRRDGAAWDVGVHYIGEVWPGAFPRRLFDYLSGEELHWNRLPDEFERFVYPGLDFAVPSDPARFAARLIARFPDEAAAIRRYFRDVRAVTRWTSLGFARGMVPNIIEPLLRVIQRLTGAKAMQSTGDYLAKNFRSPQLRALLASQWGDYGLPPASSAFAIHAQITAHYLHGAWFPDGGAPRIARSLEKRIEAAGGSVRVAQEVVEILVRGGRAVGVKVIDRRGPAPREVVIEAPLVISNAGVPTTFERLLPTAGAIGAKTAPLRALASRLVSPRSAVTLYLRLKAPVSTIGVQGENFWINADLEHDAVAARSAALLAGEPRHVYASFPSLKAGDERFHTAELISFVEEGAFDDWRHLPKGNRGPGYSALKQRIGDGLLRLAETAIPGLGELVAYSEMATPLSVEHYTSHPGGRFYGLAATPERYRSSLLGPRTPIPGLLLSGCDAGCLGIVGSMMGGVGAACQALGPTGFPRILAALRAVQPPITVATLPPEKKRATLLSKARLTDAIWQLDFELDADVADFAPGQFARMRVAHGEWRDYSIAGLDGRVLRFLISTRTGGRGSQFVSRVEPGTCTEIELPLGQYTLAHGNRHRVFVATGTGLAPFLPMFGQLARTGALGRSQLLFGCRGDADDITTRLSALPAEILRCYSRGAAPRGGIAGRVSRALEELDFEPETTEFYLCGSAAMVADCKEILERRRARHVFIEAF